MMFMHLFVLLLCTLLLVHCKIRIQEEENIDSLYGDLFSTPKDKGQKPGVPGRPGPTLTPDSKETEGSRPESDSCCRTTRHTEPFLDDHRDTSGVLWHAVWFNGTSMKAQYYEKVSCGNPSCSLVNTLRPFLMTKVRPHQEFGHSHAILNSNWLKNVKFLNHFVGGYCIRKGSLPSNPISAVTRHPRIRSCITSRRRGLRGVRGRVRSDAIRRIRIPCE